MFQLSVKDLRIWLHLGNSSEEQFNKQLVSLTIDLTFKAAPKAAVTDNLEDTICYGDIVGNVEALCQSRSFRLIEHLSAEICREVCRTLGDKKSLIASIKVALSKLAPPVPNLHGGVAFIYDYAPPEEA